MGRITRPLYGFLPLVRFGEMPVTLFTILLGYASVSGTVLTPDVLPLIAVAALGHWGVYGGLNDVFDYEWDRAQGRVDRPIVAGYISYRTAAISSTIFTVASVVLAFVYFPLGAIVTWVGVSVVTGIVYDARSKQDTYACVYLAAWGCGTVLAGALYAGDITAISLVLAGLHGVNMLWMTITGNLKDIATEEVSVPKKLGCEVRQSEQGERYLHCSKTFVRLYQSILLAGVVLFISLPMSAGITVANALLYVVIVPGEYVMNKTALNILDQRPFDDFQVKKDMLRYDTIGLALTLVAGISFIDVYSLIAMGGISVGLSVCWLKVEDALYSSGEATPGAVES